MPSKESFLVRGPTGTMATVVAQSTRGALKIYLQMYRTAHGDLVSVKPRGRGDWEEYKVSK